jgi:hypothetical protein
LLVTALKVVARARTTWAAGGVVLVLIAATAAYGPIARSAAVAAGTRRHLQVTVGSARPGWFAVRLHDVTVHPEGVPSVSVHVEDARVGLTFGFHVDRVEIHGVTVLVDGKVADVRTQVSAWRDLDPRSSRAVDASRRSATIAVDGLSLRWNGGGPEPIAAIDGLRATWDGEQLVWQTDTASVRDGAIAASVSEARGQLFRDGTIGRTRAGALVVDLGHREARVEAPRVATPTPNPTPPPPPSAMATAADPGAPLLPLPDTRVLRGELSVAFDWLAQRFREGADVGVDALTWRIERAGEGLPFTLGPGPLGLTRSDAAFEVQFSTDARVASTPLAVRVLLPRKGDPAVSLEGGPVSLSLLGVQEGGGGMVDVDRTTISGRARLVLADDGSALTFDGEGGARDLSIANPRLALETVRGLDLQFHGRGTTTADGELRLDDLGASVGGLHGSMGGVLDQKPDHVTGSFHFEVPRSSCESLHDSLPSALLPALQGMRFSGTIGASGHFQFDTRNLDALELAYDVQDQCKVTQVPPELEHSRFEQAFTHGIYLPDGTILDDATGPGTPNWTPLDDVSPYMKVAVLTTEDGGFPKHHGFNRASIRLALVANLKARRFARGASTITMQLAKNLFLSRDKVLSRKLEEVVLTDYLEQTFTKDEILELYLNVIEFGPAVYGITAAADYYFGRTPAELDLAECLFLSSLLPSPIRYGAMRDNAEVPEGWMRLLRRLMDVAHHYGRVTDEELAEGQKESVVFWHGGERPTPRPPVRAQTDFENESGDVQAPPLDTPQR